MRDHILYAGALLIAGSAFPQTQILVTNSAADSVLMGRYNPSRYAGEAFPGDIAAIVPDMAARISPDSLRNYLTRLVSFHNRNSGADTVSPDTGIGAARRWIYSRFQQFSAQSGGRLIPAYLQFNQTICSAAQHRNILAVLPGRDTSNHAVLVVMAHMDSRCESNCNTTCRAHGADDNGSGTALVMELARVLSRYSFKHTIVFSANMGEEQGLYGAAALATYFVNNNTPVMAAQNNDIVGGIVCGPTSWRPRACPAPRTARTCAFSRPTSISPGTRPMPASSRGNTSGG
jgi:hypothetical protein